MPEPNPYLSYKNSLSAVEKMLNNKKSYLSRATSRHKPVLEGEISILIKLINDFNTLIETLESDLDNKEIIIRKFKTEKLILESICLLHGIDDFPALASKGPGLLADEVTHKNYLYIPNQLKSLFT